MEKRVIHFVLVRASLMWLHTLLPTISSNPFDSDILEATKRSSGKETAYMFIFRNWIPHTAQWPCYKIYFNSKYIYLRLCLEIQFLLYYMS